MFLSTDKAFKVQTVEIIALNAKRQERQQMPDKSENVASTSVQDNSANSQKGANSS